MFMRPELQSADKLARAALCASQSHANQTRDDGKTPYVVHVFRVAEYLRSIGGESDEDVLCAAYLHDTIEDCGATFDTIAGQFGAEVAALVAELTNDNRLPKNQRRSTMIDHLHFVSPRAKRIKLADRLDNVTDLLRGTGSTPEKCQRYILETERILKACEDACPPLEDALRAVFDELKQRVAQALVERE